MAQNPLSIFKELSTPVAPAQFNLKDYTAPGLGPQASSGDNPYDKWLYAQNARLSNFSLPAYASKYNQVFNQPQVQAPAGGQTYTSQQPKQVWEQPQGSQAAATQTPATQNGFAGVQTVLGPYSNAPKSADQVAYESQRAQIQDIVAKTPDATAAIQELANKGFDYKTINDALSYSGSPLGNQSTAEYIRVNSVGVDSPVEGLTSHSPEAITNFINWQNSQISPITGDQLNYDVNDARYRANVQETMDRELRLAKARGQEAPAWSVPALAAGGLVRPYAKGGLADMAHNYGINRRI
jgi:hypothetical protein